MTAVQPGLLADPAVPGLALLLDDARLGRWLEAHGQRLRERRYVRYKPGTSCVVGLRLDSGWAFALATSAAGRPKLDKLGGPGQGLLALDERHGLALASIWADRDLPALADLPRAVARLLPDLGPHEVRTLVHKPHRRWVGLVEAPGAPRPVLLRAYRRARAADAASRLKLARRVGRVVQVPRLLARTTRYAALAVEFVPGEPLHAPSVAGAAGAPLAEVGRALARVHRREPAGMPPTDVADPAATVDLVATLLPHLRPRASDLLAALVARRPARPEPRVCHGDFSLDQVVVRADGGLAFVDWDRGGAGAPGADLGSLVASGLAGPALGELQAGYEDVRALPPDLDWYVARARLLRLAEPFRTASPGWAVEVEERVAALEESWA